MPRYLPKADIENELHKVKDWCKNEFSKNPDLLNRFRVIVYQNGEFIRVFGQDFKLLFFKEKRKGITGKLTKGNNVELRLPMDAEEYLVQEAIGKLLSRIFSSFFLNDVVEPS